MDDRVVVATECWKFLYRAITLIEHTPLIVQLALTLSSHQVRLLCQLCFVSTTAIVHQAIILDKWTPGWKLEMFNRLTIIRQICQTFPLLCYTVSTN